MESFLFRELPFPLEHVRKKQWVRGTKHSVISEPMPAEPLHSSLSPHREVSPILFSHPYQHPSAAAINLVLFGWSECDAMNDSLSLIASDAEEPSGLSFDPDHCRLQSPVLPAQAWMLNSCASCLKLFKNWVWIGLCWRNQSATAWMNGSY